MPGGSLTGHKKLEKNRAGRGFFVSFRLGFRDESRAVGFLSITGIGGLDFDLRSHTVVTAAIVVTTVHNTFNAAEALVLFGDSFLHARPTSFS